MAEMYPWLLPVFQQLQGQVSRGQLAHAILLSGPAGIGKMALADALAALLLCKNQQIDGACGTCKSCLLRQAGNHADLLMLHSDTNNIGVDAVRQLTRFSQGASQQHGSKVMIIPAADSMTEAAANALLKTLEEPPAGCYLVLVSQNPLQLSATIRSRCQQWQLSAGSAAQLHDWLSGQTDTPLPPFLLDYCQGAPLKAQALLQSNKLEAVNASLTLLADYVSGKAELSRVVKALDGDDELAGILGFFIKQRLSSPLEFIRQQALLTAYQRWCRDAALIIGQNSALALSSLLTELQSLLQHQEAKWKS